MATSRTLAPDRIARDRQAERALWGRYGLEPTERFIDLDAPVARLRVLEVGTGTPVLFVHGTAGPGSLAGLVGELDGLRRLVLDRPGWAWALGSTSPGTGTGRWSPTC